MRIVPVVAALAVVLLTGACGSAALTASPPSSTVATVAASPPPAAAGAVGMNGREITVPAGWTPARKAACDQPPEADTYYLDVPDVSGPDALQPPCPAPPPTTPPDHLVIGAADEQLGFGQTQPQHDGVTCRGTACVGQWTDRDADVRFLATVSGPDARRTLTAMGATIGPVPDGSTTVPGWPLGWQQRGDGSIAYLPESVDEYRTLVEQAGLVLDVPPSADLDDPYADPAEGTVVAAGSTVEVVATVPSSDTPSSTPTDGLAVPSGHRR